MIRLRLAFAAALAGALCLPQVAAARPSSSGVYAEAGLGAAALVGNAGQYSQAGFSADLRVGYDVFSWLAIGGRLGIQNHRARVPPPPEREYYQVYVATAEARISIPIGALALFFDGGVGMSAMSTNVLAKVDVLDPGERASIRFAGGGGIEYQLQNRHLALGLGGEAALMPAFAGAVSTGGRLYLRYTY